MSITYKCDLCGGESSDVKFFVGISQQDYPDFCDACNKEIQAIYAEEDEACAKRSSERVEALMAEKKQEKIE